MSDVHNFENDGLEAEGELHSSLFPEKIERPFDPSKIKVTRKIVPISSIVQRIEHHEIDLSPDFQRRARIWDIRRKSRLIESILLRIPLPVFYVSSDGDDNWQVVDGLQRLTTIYDFLKFESEYSFYLQGLEYLTAYEGSNFSELPRSIVRRILETELNVNVIEYGTPDAVMFNIFRRLNTGGISLNSQEIRNALHPGPVREFLEDLAGSDEFLGATSAGVRDERMGARELVLRYCAFKMSSFRDYAQSDLDSFLNEAMKKINEMNEFERYDLRADFLRAMKFSSKIFNDQAFRKNTSPDGRRSPINRALFEAVSVNISKHSDECLNEISRNPRFLPRYVSILNNDVFLRSISLSTGSGNAVANRFKYIENLFSEFCND